MSPILEKSAVSSQENARWTRSSFRASSARSYTMRENIGDQIDGIRNINVQTTVGIPASKGDGAEPPLKIGDEINRIGDVDLPATIGVATSVADRRRIAILCRSRRASQ